MRKKTSYTTNRRMSVALTENEIKLVHYWREGEKPMSSRPMNACERGNWIDTEGNISLVPTPVIVITQKDFQALQDYCEGAKRDSIPCRVKRDPRVGAYRAFITGAHNVAKEITLTQPYIRTQEKKRQIERLRRYLAQPRKKLYPTIREARKILRI